MLGNRSRATKSALAVWLLVLVADAAASGTALLVYLLSGVVAVAIVVAAVAATRNTAGRPRRLASQPIPVRADREYDHHRR